MADTGLFGGLAEGFTSGRQLQLQKQQLSQKYELGTRRLQIEQQGQEAAQKRFDTARHDEIAATAIKDLISVAQQMKAAGKSDADVQKALGHSLDMLRQNAKLRGVDAATAVDIPFKAALGTPSFNFAQLIEGASGQYGVPQDQLHNAVQQESGGNPNAVSQKGAKGVAQFMPQTAASRGVNPMNPSSAIPGMASYVSDLNKQFGNLGLAWAAYNWGPGNMQQWVKNGADPSKMPKETQNYVLSVTGKPIEEWVKGGAQPQQQNPEQLNTMFAAINSPTTDTNVKKILAERLNKIVNPGSQVQAKVLKDENGNDHVVFINPETRTVTDQNGNPYVMPSEGSSDAGVIANAIASGKQPPVLTGLYRNGKAVRAALARQNVDLTQLQLEFDAAKKQVQSLNGPQMTRYAGLAHSVINTIDEVRNLSGELKNGGVPIANQAKLMAYIQTAGNSESGQLASRYIAAVNTLKEEFANLAQGGYAPTEAAWALANQQINGNYGVKQLDASLTEVQRLLRYRLMGIPNFTKLGPAAPNRYTGSQGESMMGAPPANSTNANHKDWQQYFQ